MLFNVDIAWFAVAGVSFECGATPETPPRIPALIGILSMGTRLVGSSASSMGTSSIDYRPIPLIVIFVFSGSPGNLVPSPSNIGVTAPRWGISPI